MKAIWGDRPGTKPFIRISLMRVPTCSNGNQTLTCLQTGFIHTSGSDQVVGVYLIPALATSGTHFLTLGLNFSQLTSGLPLNEQVRKTTLKDMRPGHSLRARCRTSRVRSRRMHTREVSSVPQWVNRRFAAPCRRDRVKLSTHRKRRIYTMRSR